MNARERWYDEYRVARAAYSLYRRFRPRLESLPYPSFMPVGEFDFCRLHGDRLGVFTYRRRGRRQTHEVRVMELYKRVSLPA